MLLQVLDFLRAPNMGGHWNWFCRMVMLPLGSHQANWFRMVCAMRATKGRQLKKKFTMRATKGDDTGRSNEPNERGA